MKLKGLSPLSAIRDVLTGVIIALVSIPISMGYAQVAGLPPVYGLYGSVFPILIFGLLSTSDQFIFGVDAAPAALVGTFIAARGIESGSDEAVSFVPVITIFVGLWLLLMYVFRAGKLVTYISTPVMGGFISGISTTIIFMQIPKVLGGTSGCGEIAELIRHIYLTCRNDFNATSALLGGVSLCVLLISRKLCPKLPMSVLVMAAGAMIGSSGFAADHNVALLSAIDSGLPAWKLPDMRVSGLSDALSTSLTIAVVIMAETLLASNSSANKRGVRINNNREILVYSLGNLSAGLTGCCPVNGSVSRTAMGEQYGGRSQLMSLSASAVMAGILLFGTGFIKYLPVPVLTSIVISALLGAVEFDLMERLFRHDRKELMIFFGAFFGVLIFGTVYGVMIGVALSFISVIARTADPKRSYLGVISGHEGFHSLERNKYAVPLKKAVIYRFSGNLYFANINLFIADIESAMTDETECVVIDSGAVCSIDITAADRIITLRSQLKTKGIKLYFASHIGSLNDRFRQLGLGDMVEEGYCRMTISSALLSAGITPPYETSSAPPEVASSRKRLEFEWAFGSMTDDELEKYTEKLLSRVKTPDDPEKQLQQVLGTSGLWKGISEPDQEELLAHISIHISELAQKLNIDETQVEEAIEMRKLLLAHDLETKDPEMFRVVREHSRRLEAELEEKDKKLYEALLRHRREALNSLRQKKPEYSELIETMYGKEI